MELNKVFIIGNLTRDPEARFLQSGSQVCKMGMASNRRYSSSGERREETLFIDIEAWGKTAELCSQYLRKGSQILVEGRLKMDQYQTREGDKRTRYVIVADRVQFGARAEGGGQGGGSRPAESRSPQQSQDRYDNDMPGSEGATEDGLPFWKPRTICLIHH